LKRQKLTDLIAGSVALLLLFGATLLLSLELYVWDALLLLVLALVTLVALMRRRWDRRVPGPFECLRFQWQPRTPTGWLRGLAFAAAIVAAVSARIVPEGRSYWIPLIIWVVGITVYVAPLLLTLWRTRRMIRPRMAHWEWPALLLLIVIAGALRGIRLGDIPYSLGGDEGTQLVAGLDLVRAPLGNPFATGWYSVPTMSFFAYGLVMRFLGATMSGGRALSALLGTTTVIGSFFLGRIVSGRRVGWWSAIVLAASAYHIHFSRLASNQVGDSWVGVLAMGLLWLGYESENRPKLSQAAWGLAGVIAGLGWYGYFGARWVTILMALFLLWRALADPGFLYRRWRALGLLALGGAIALLPLLGWYVAHPSSLAERYNAVSVFASGWMAREQELTGHSVAYLMGQQIWKAFTAFHLTPDPTFWYRPGRPLLDFVASALLLIGIMGALVRGRRPSRTLVLLGFFSTVFMAWAMTENPPSSQRGVLLMPFVAVLTAWGLRDALQLLPLESSRRRWLAWGILAAVVILNVGFYFAVYTPLRVYGNPTAEVATAIGHYLRTNPEPICTTVPDGFCEGRVYFLGAPSLYWSFGSLRFLARGVPGEDILPDDRPLAVVPPARFVVTPYRIDDLSWIEASYPQGIKTTLQSPDGRLLAVIYDWHENATVQP
jgi:hypothetical protein